MVLGFLLFPIINIWADHKETVFAPVTMCLPDSLLKAQKNINAISINVLLKPSDGMDRISCTKLEIRSEYQN